jgi:hypothetical protein
MNKKGLNQIDWIISLILFLTIIFFVVVMVKPITYKTHESRDYSLFKIKKDIYNSRETEWNKIAFTPINCTYPGDVAINLSSDGELETKIIGDICIFRRDNSFNYTSLNYSHNNKWLNISNVPSSGVVYLSTQFNCEEQDISGTNNVDKTIIGYDEVHKLHNCSDEIEVDQTIPVNVTKTSKYATFSNGVAIPKRGSIYSLEFKDFCYYFNETSNKFSIETVTFNIRTW